MLRPAARATAREGGNASQDGLQLLLAYLATNTKELRQLQCPDIAAPLRAGEARRGKPAIPFRAAKSASSGPGRLGCVSRGSTQQMQHSLPSAQPCLSGVQGF